MSGRAGRRGIDERGIVIMIVDEKLEPEVGKSLLKVGKGVHLVFRMLSTQVGVFVTHIA